MKRFVLKNEFFLALLSNNFIIKEKLTSDKVNKKMGSYLSWKNLYSSYFYFRLTVLQLYSKISKLYIDKDYYLKFFCYDLLYRYEHYIKRDELIVMLLR